MHSNEVCVPHFNTTSIQLKCIHVYSKRTLYTSIHIHRNSVYFNAASINEHDLVLVSELSVCLCDSTDHQHTRRIEKDE